MPLGCTGRTLQYDHEPSLYFGDCCPVRLAYWRPCVDRNYLDAEEWRDLVGAYLDARPAARDTGLGRRRGGNWRRSDRHRRAIRGRIAFDDSNVLAFCVVVATGGATPRAGPPRAQPPV